MGYYRDATEEEIARGEATSWSLRTPDDAKDLPIDERFRRTSEADMRYDHKVWVSEPSDDWLTAVQLVSENGYRPEALTRLFGPATNGPDGIRGWLAVHVDHIEETVINRAVELLKTSLFNSRLEDLFPVVAGPEDWPSEAEAADMIAGLAASNENSDGEVGV
ncbi:hypothetical protein BJF84_17495 [Rhodococcus sp. CUA-806]|jgi:hypothetical protein|nr:hypothetical protein BJF84_17495 [Rhodococcus sp. CUA-806]